MPQTPQTKTANLYDWLIAHIHSNFSVMADELYGNGRLNQEERKLCSGGIEVALEAWNTFASTNLGILKERTPWEDAPVLDIPEIAENYAIKMLNANRIGAYLTLWGDEKRKDLSGEFFTPKTLELKSIFEQVGVLPFFYNHATDGAVKSEMLGTVDILSEDELGLWYEAQLRKNSQYRMAFQKLIDAKALGTSGGCLPGARQVAKNGEILRWPIMEVSATPTPMEPRQLMVPISAIKGAYTELGIVFPEPKVETGKVFKEELTKALCLLELIEIEGVLYDSTRTTSA
jgi:hypothetical protein